MYSKVAMIIYINNEISNEKCLIMLFILVLTCIVIPANEFFVFYIHAQIDFNRIEEVLSYIACYYLFY